VSDASGSGALARLETRVRDDVARIAHPRATWLTPKAAPGGGEALDVLIVGAGQSGLATAFGLQRSRVDNILLLDRAPEGREGPWNTYARMRTLRSPKDFTGPDLDVPSLTYQSWHEARYGEASWGTLDLIAREDWADYLLWFRRALALPVRNGVEVKDVAAAEGGLLRVEALSAAGAEVFHTRKLVLATGQEGMGGWTVPPPLDALGPRFCAHVAAPIDFAALRGRTVAVIGAGASAFDNAATALEAGAAAVHLLCRRAQVQVVQPYRWLTFRGFLRHLADLDDTWRWRFMRRVLDLREGFPQATFDRCAIHRNFHLQTGAPVTGATIENGRVRLETPSGAMAVDFVICGTGIDMDFSLRPELARMAGNIATWADRYTPPAAERDERLGRFPYLADDYSLSERIPGRTPWMRNVHVFAIASTMSFGASGSSINAMTTAVPRLVQGLTRGLFTADVEAHWAAFQAYDVPQAVVRSPQAD